MTTSTSSVQSFKDYLQSNGNSKATADHYNRCLLDFLGWLDKDNTEVENATAKEVLVYLSVLQKRGWQNPTRNTSLGVIKKFFNYQIEHGQRTDNPIQHLKIRGKQKQKLYPIFDRQQLEKLYHNYQVPGEEDKRAKRNWFKGYKLSRTRNKAIISLMINQALTTAEVNKLEVKDLKLKEGKIYIGGSRKSNERTLELKSNQIMELMEYTWQVRPLLLKYQKDENIKNLFLATPAIGRKSTGDSLHVWKRLSEELKEQDKEFINFKQVRASIITHWLKQFNLRQVQYMAGHRYVSSTEAYMVNQVDDLQKDVDQFHPF